MSEPAWQLSAASPADDSALRRLLRETPLTGSLTVTLEREPSFFAADADTLRHDAVLARRHGQPAACGSRLLRRAWWHGQPAPIAYLSDLRVHPSCQNRAGRIIARGFRSLEEAAHRHPAAVTWTAVFEGNHRARRTLTGRHAGLPAYTDRGRLVCPMLPVPRKAKPPRLPSITWHTASAGDWEEIAAFLTERQGHRPLAPVHTAEDFANGIRWPGLRATDFLLVRKDGALRGVIAVWDQRSFRQVRIHRLSAPLACLRPLSRLAARLTGWPPLPADGTVLPMAHIAFLAAAGDDPVLARALLLAARAAAAERHLHWLCLCLHESDPLLPALRRLPALASHGRLYQVSRAPAPWPAAAAPVIESATL